MAATLFTRTPLKDLLITPERIRAPSLEKASAFTPLKVVEHQKALAYLNLLQLQPLPMSLSDQQDMLFRELKCKAIQLQQHAEQFKHELCISDAANIKKLSEALAKAFQLKLPDVS